MCPVWSVSEISGLTQQSVCLLWNPLLRYLICWSLVTCVTYSLAVLYQGWPCQLEFIFPSLACSTTLPSSYQGRSSWEGSWEGDESANSGCLKACWSLAGHTLKGQYHDLFGALPAQDFFCIMESTWKGWCSPECPCFSSLDQGDGILSNRAIRAGWGENIL